MTSSFDRVLLVPGLLEPAIWLWPLQVYLRTRFPKVELWQDRIVFRDLERSVERLAAFIGGAEGERIGIVTHSFGDWVVRQAMARACEHRVEAIVSVTPVMRAGLLTSLAYKLTGNLIPELGVINDPTAAAANAADNLCARRLVLWAKVDALVAPVHLPPAANLTVRRIAATHMTIIVQPDVHAQIARWLAAEEAEETEEA